MVQGTTMHILLFFLSKQWIICYSLRSRFHRNSSFYTMQEDQEELKAKLTEYKGEHKALDDLIERALESDTPVNLLYMQQLKKKKLWLKDMIQKLESALIDDIIA